jgi:hypothetical protein
MNNILEASNVIQLQQQAPNLESLIITNCSGDYFNNLRFRNLKHLKLTDANFSVEEWTRFADRNPLIEKVVVKDEYINNEIFRIICLEFRNLKHLELNYDPQKLTIEILDFIFDSNFPSNIRILKIAQRVSSADDFFTLSDEHKKALNANLGFQCNFN